MQGHGLPPPQELWSYQSRLSSLLKLAIRRCVWLVFVALPIQSLTDPCLGSFSIVHLKEHPGWGPTLRSVPQACDGPASLLSSCQCWPVGGRGYGDGSTRYTRRNSIALVPWLPGFPLQAFPTISSLTSPLCSQEQPSPWDCSTIPGDLRPCPGYAWLQQGLSDSHSVQAATEQLSHSQP